MTYYSTPLNLMLEENEVSKKSFKQKSPSRKGHHRSAKHNKLHTHGNKEHFQTQAKENTYSSDDSAQYVPIEDKVLRKLKRERKLLKKWTVELNRAKSEICNSNADEFSTVDPKISEIQKRYHILLPAIKLAMDTMDQAILSKSSMNDASSIKHLQQGNGQAREIQESLEEDLTNQGPAERKRARWLKESKGTYQFISEKNLNEPGSRNSLMLTDISKQQLYRRVREEYSDSKKVLANIEAIDEIKDPQSHIEHCQPLKPVSARHVKGSGIQCYKPGADGEAMEEINVSNHMKRKSALEIVTDKKGLKDDRQTQRRMDIRNESKLAPTAVVSVNNKYHSSRHFREVEQDVLRTGPNYMSTLSTPSFPSTPAQSAEITSSDLRSQTSMKTIGNVSKMNSSEDKAKCKCKDKKNSKPCICKCYCEEESVICDSNTSLTPVLTSVPSSSGEEGRFVKRKPSLEPKNREPVQVQTSFPSSIGPCKPETCPKRQKRRVENREIEVQTDDTDIEWQYEPPMTQVKRNVISAFKIPPKRTATMDDRLLRRIMYFDSHQSSVCNKNVQFCTYNVHQTKKGFPKDAEQVPCLDCPGSRKCKLVISQRPYHLTCNEIVVEVNSLELNQDGVDSLMKVCSFLYIDYVFLGHVGNETSLAPVSSSVLFDSRKSYSVSLRFNKKERSILREQVSPSGLLVKDSIMFIVVCQAAPEFDINKNWDFGFGYLSMKEIGEQTGSKDKISMEVEMQKIGGTKNTIGRLLVTIEGLETIKGIMNEELRCIEPQVDAVMNKLKLNRKEMTAVENKRTTRKKQTSKRRKNEH